MLTKAEALGQGMYEAIGRIMKSHNFQILTDIYGNIPYSEAFQGTVTPTPKYDKSIDIYKGIFADLDLAVALLQDLDASDPARNPDIATADLVYAGNRASWLRFANTLRLRMLVHLHNGITTTTVAPGIDVAAEVAKFTPEGFMGAGQSAHINPGFSGTKPQPYYRVYNTSEAGTGSQRDHLRASLYAIEYYKADRDWRIGAFYTAPVAITNTTNPAGVQQTNYFTAHKGINFGTPSGGSAPTGDALSNIRGKGLSPNGAASRAWIMTSMESLFLQAEARERGIITTGPTAETLLNAGILESFIWLDAKRPPIRNVANTQDSVTFSAADTYAQYMEYNMGYPDVDYNAAPLGGVEAGLYTILQQKWFALNMIAPYELWTDWRRTGIVYGIGGGYTPGPPLSVDPNAGNQIPVRLFYPQNEYNYNAENVAAEGTVNIYTGRIFWDIN
jgi:hypothetical protein